VAHHAAADGEEIAHHANDQDWLVSWHTPSCEPEGQRHGAAGICLTGSDEVVLVSVDGTRWEFPAGRPQGAESEGETLRREVLEEACASVLRARLLGYSRGRCLRGAERGLILVRSVWLAHVNLEPWVPAFETVSRRVVPAADVLAHMAPGAGHLRIYRRAFIDAGLTAV
jgi:8-oxo-dGTP pyrophosphatase MutT (NUDIX family)